MLEAPTPLELIQYPGTNMQTFVNPTSDTSDERSARSTPHQQSSHSGAAPHYTPLVGLGHQLTIKCLQDTAVQLRALSHLLTTVNTQVCRDIFALFQSGADRRVACSDAPRSVYTIQL